MTFYTTVSLLISIHFLARYPLVTMSTHEHYFMGNVYLYECFTDYANVEWIEAQSWLYVFS